MESDSLAQNSEAIRFYSGAYVWFYSHPAVYIMMFPGFSVISEIIACFSRKKIFGYHFVAYSSMAIASDSGCLFRFHMYVSSQSMYQGTVFSLLSFLVAIPSAVKVFNSCFGRVRKDWFGSHSDMIYAISLFGLFVIAFVIHYRYVSCRDGDGRSPDGDFFIVAHFHYVMVGGTWHLWEPCTSGGPR